MASFYVSRATVRESIIARELPLTSDTVYSEIQNDLLKPIFVSSTMANDTFLRDWILDGEKDIGKITKYLAEIRDKYDTFSSFLVSERTRNYYYADGILKQVDTEEPRDRWYFRVRQMEPPYEINVDPDMANRDAMTIFINYKVFDFEGNFIGATGVGLTVGMVKNMIRDYQERYQRNIFFTDTNGDIVLHNAAPESVLGRVRSIRSLSGLAGIADQVLQRRQANFEYQLNGANVLLNVRFIPELNWYLLVEQTEEASLTPVRNIMKINLAICVVVTFLSAWFLSRIINRWQQCLANRNRELEENNRRIEAQRVELQQQAKSLAHANRRLDQIIDEKDELLNVVAHDLKSPLIGISGLSQVILEHDLDREETRENVDLILASATKMSVLINDLLNIAALENGASEVRQLVDVGDLVTIAVENFRAQAKVKQIDLQVELPEQSIHYVTKEFWMQKIVHNLISNAIKFSDEQSTVRVELSRTANRLRFLVQDRGPGLTDEDKKRLFQRFSPLNNKPVSEESSTGLGLYIVKKIVTRMHGTVTCDSRSGQGATFIVELPLETTVPPGD